MAMEAAAALGSILIRITTDTRGRVNAVVVSSTRPTGLGRLFIGRSSVEAPALAARLFTLCGFSHTAAARLAVMAARGEAPGTNELTSIALGLAAEQAGELLRASILHSPRTGRAADLARLAAPLRDALAASRELVAAADREAFPESATAFSSLVAATETLGLRRSGALRPGSFFATMMEEAQSAAFPAAQPPDALLPADDAAVVAALREGGAGFAATPSLPGRIIETGPFARRWQDTLTVGNAISARLAARFLSLCDALDRIQLTLDNGFKIVEPATIAQLGEGEGYAAVETARGRLYHCVRLDTSDRIANYELVAPTEWNFHADGPLVAMLRDAELGLDPQLEVQRLASVFDPCVAFDVALQEAVDA